MNLLVGAPVWLLIALSVLLLVAALEDAVRMRISNFTVMLIAACAVVAIAYHGPSAALWQNLLLAALVLTVGTVMFARGWMGGGDIKLLTACALWLDLQSGWKMLVAVAIAGGLETIVILILRRLPWAEQWGNKCRLFRRRGGIPYGIAIACGMVLMLAWSPR
nr:prepilin peptidase [uncultured Sphingomonas sp.]